MSSISFYSIVKYTMLTRPHTDKICNTISIAEIVTIT